MLNVHHLELFFYVACHGGISRAVRKIPYGIQQPAVSGQILQLEHDLGTKLFERSPFRLTPAGEELYAFVQPFFANLDTVEEKLRDRSAPQLRLGSSDLVLRYHLPAIIERLRALQPNLRLALRSGFQAETETWLEERQIDLAVIPLDKRPAARIRCLRLVRIPLVVLVLRKSGIRTAAELWQRDPIEEPLICLPSSESITARFRAGLNAHHVDWPVTIEASSLDLVTAYVANGYGIGVSVNLPEVVKNPRVRVLPLDDFSPLEIAALWLGSPTPLVRMVLDEARRYVAQPWPQWQCEEAAY